MCIRDSKTAISDLEVVPTDVSTQIYYIKYPSSNSESITIATVRPETIFGDVAIAVNPPMTVDILH